MTKNGSGIDIDLLSQTDTEERNGVEIKVEVDSSKLYEYADAIYSLYYIPNLYIEDQSGVDSLHSSVIAFNQRRIVHYKNFSSFPVLSYKPYGQPKIVLGNILYQVDLSKIKPLPAPFDTIDLSRYGITSDLFGRFQVPFEIGSLDVTPNREALLYSERTIKTLRDGYVKALSEIREMFLEKAKLCSDIFYWYYRIKEEILHLRNDNETIANLDVSPIVRNIKTKYKNREMPPISSDIMWRINNLGIHTLPNSFILRNGEILRSKSRHKLALRSTILHSPSSDKDTVALPKVIVIGNSRVSSSLVRSYIKEKYGKYDNAYYIVMQNISFKEFYAYISNEIRYYNENEDFDKECPWLCKEVMKAFSKDIVFDDVESSQEFLDWKEARKSNASPAVRRTSTDPFRVYITHYTEDYYTYCSMLNVKKDIKTIDDIVEQVKIYTGDKASATKAIIYGEMHSKYWDLLDKFSDADEYKTLLKRFILVKVAATNMKYLKNLPKKCISVEDFLYQMKGFQKYLTYRKFIRGKYDSCDCSVSNFLHNIGDYIVEEDFENIKMALEYMYNIPDLSSDCVCVLNQSLEKFKENGVPYDEDLVTAFKTLDRYAKVVPKVLHLYSEGIMRRALLAYFCMKHKLFRMNFKAYNELKEQLKIKVL